MQFWFSSSLPSSFLHVGGSAGSVPPWINVVYLVYSLVPHVYLKSTTFPQGAADQTGALHETWHLSTSYYLSMASSFLQHEEKWHPVIDMTNETSSWCFLTNILWQLADSSSHVSQFICCYPEETMQLSKLTLFKPSGVSVPDVLIYQRAALGCV